MADLAGIKASKAELIIEGIRELMRSAPVQDLIDAEGKRLESEADPDLYEYVAMPHKWVARGFVRTKGLDGARDNAMGNTLVRVVGGQGRKVVWVRKSGAKKGTRQWITQKQADQRIAKSKASAQRRQERQRLRDAQKMIDSVKGTTRKPRKR